MIVFLFLDCKKILFEVISYLLQQGTIGIPGKFLYVFLSFQSLNLYCIRGLWNKHGIPLQKGILLLSHNFLILTWTSGLKLQDYFTGDVEAIRDFCLMGEHSVPTQNISLFSALLLNKWCNFRQASSNNIFHLSIIAMFGRSIYVTDTLF